MSDSFQPYLPIVDREAADEIRNRRDLEWFHNIEVDGYTTPGYLFEEEWRFTADFLKRNQRTIEGAAILEPGCADGLWTCWLTKLGARHIDSSDIDTREQFQLVTRAFGLPVTYYPGIISTELPKKVKRAYDLVVSFGVLYHVHDPLTTLAMYVRYLRDGGVLFLETGAIDAQEVYLYYTGTGEMYPKSGGNHFIPTMGFLTTVLPEFGMTIDDTAFRLDGHRDGLGRPAGRTIIAARKTGGVEVVPYPKLVEQLEMSGPEFPRQRWYDWVV